MASYDLHLHTEWSYDACAPVEYYFSRARELRLRCIAVTEHHHMDSLDEIRQACRRYPVQTLKQSRQGPRRFRAWGRE